MLWLANTIASSGELAMAGACDTGRLASTVHGRQAPRRDPPNGGGGGSGGDCRPARSGCEQSYVAQFVRAAPQLSQRPWRSMVNVPSAAAAHAATAAPLRRSARGLSTARALGKCPRRLGAVERLRRREAPAQSRRCQYAWPLGGAACCPRRTPRAYL